MSDKTIPIMVVAGVEGPSLYVNNFRIVGNKPWGGGKTIYQWEVPLEKLLQYLKEAGVIKKIDERIWIVMKCDCGEEISFADEYFVECPHCGAEYILNLRRKKEADGHDERTT